MLVYCGGWLVWRCDLIEDFSLCLDMPLQRGRPRRGGGNHAHLITGGGRASSSSEEFLDNLDREEEIAQNPATSHGHVV